MLQSSPRSKSDLTAVLVYPRSRLCDPAPLNFCRRPTELVAAFRNRHHRLVFGPTARARLCIDQTKIYSRLYRLLLNLFRGDSSQYDYSGVDHDYEDFIQDSRSLRLSWMKSSLRVHPKTISVVQGSSDGAMTRPADRRRF